MIDPRRPYRDDDVPPLDGLALVELMEWLGADPRRWAAAAAQHWEGGGADLADTLESWFAAALETGRLEIRRTLPSPNPVD